MAPGPETASRTAAWYRHFGLVEAPESSPCYAEWTLGIADDPELVSWIDVWPHDKRQPNLLLAAARRFSRTATATSSTTAQLSRGCPPFPRERKVRLPC
ncbi:DUF2332 family protein [Arthrobacter sp. ISL-48]|uniref:DUF2332 family protein n=1 Tax=Arthrobacter sp. ISL-48 TaxID=2819110 RepID=UPI00203625B3|nr:DUF2332 family protein [Arthrobacter sp. ISL-48]